MLGFLPEAHQVVQYLAHNPEFLERQLQFFRFRDKCAANEIISLSMTSCQFRRISLPFLFAYIAIRREGDLEKLRDRCAANEHFADSIRPARLLLVVNPRKKSTLFRNFFLTFKTFHNSSWMQLVLIRYMMPYNTTPLQPLLGQCSAWMLDSHLALGMQVRQLITSPTVLDGSFGNRNFRGLCELEIIMGASLIVLPWLSEFTNAHPQLQKIRFTNYRREYFKHNDTIEFLLPFLEDLRREELTECMDIKGFSVTRTPNSASPYRHWHWSDRVMYLAHSRFPYISTLTIEHGCTPVDGLITSLSRFSSLQVVSLLHTFTDLHCDCRRPSAVEDVRLKGNCVVETHRPSLGGDEKHGPAATEAAMIWHAARIAKCIPSIEAFYIEEDGFEGLGEYDGYWTIMGWINAHVLRSIEGRDAGGILCFIPPTRHPRFGTPEYRHPKYFQTKFYL
ncbi:hypothetical protein BT96DRAFT_919480 [Gymnopus androsaceus JB14]|uniref:Uncharacterized protein n=1 Tax=Gymnopus androsaceus JB14 TaxID=1447944 RepID=A0A6A4HR87_9AGAR|nr:hypothetical protein BT96DRAFT_919480 [Gymnopus androsaceus JB14]